MVNLTAESTAPEPTPKPKSQGTNPIVRIVLLVVLVIGIILLIFDRSAQSSAKALYDALEETQDKEQSLSNQDVQQLAGKAPDVAYEHETIRHLFVEEYKWRGAFNSYRVYCYYQSAADKLLDSFTLNEPADF